MFEQLCSFHISLKKFKLSSQFLVMSLGMEEFLCQSAALNPVALFLAVEAERMSHAGWKWYLTIRWKQHLSCEWGCMQTFNYRPSPLGCQHLSSLFPTKSIMTFKTFWFAGKKCDAIYTFATTGWCTKWMAISKPKPPPHLISSEDHSQTLFSITSVLSH